MPPPTRAFESPAASSQTSRATAPIHQPFLGMSNLARHEERRTQQDLEWESAAEDAYDRAMAWQRRVP